MKKGITILSIVLPGIAFFISESCNTANNNIKPCNMACTMIFTMITAQVTDVHGNNIVLDSVYTTRPSTGEMLHLQQPMVNGTYVVLDDSYMNHLRRSSDTFVFYGIKNGVKVVNQAFLISADCCHVQKLNGSSEITIQ